MFDEPTRVEGLSIDRYWKDERLINGTTWSAGYHDENDCCYFDPESFILQTVFGFCGCGMPEEAGRYIRQALQEIHDHKASGFKTEISGLGSMFHSEGECYLVWYVIDKAGLTEHGGAVPGWLTDKGEEILHDLNIIYSTDSQQHT